MPKAVPSLNVNLPEETPQNTNTNSCDRSYYNTEELQDSGFSCTETITEEEFLDPYICYPASSTVTEDVHMDSGTFPSYKDSQTQTDPVILDYTVDRQDYLNKVRKLETQIKELECQLHKASTAVDAMRSIFTEGQIRKLMAPSQINWKWEDISNAICLHASGPRAYNHLYKKGCPLPHISTLQRWCRKVNIAEGLIKTAIDFMKQIPDLEPEDKICALAFDEMKVMDTYEYDQVSDTVLKRANYVQVIMARGVRKSWKQPVYFDFDKRMTTNILYEVISELHKVGFPVVAIVCDMGSTNYSLWNEMKVTIDKPWISNPVNADEKVFVFADVPHLLKLIRNHLLDTGIVYNDTLVTPRTFEELLKHTSSSDVSISFKLTNEHLTAKGSARQKVKLAAQLFSNTVANAIRRCYSVGKEMYNPINTADFVQLVNDWFDVHNSTLNTFTYPGKEPFGLELEKQKEILLNMNAVLSENILPSKRKSVPFQRGIITSNNALIMLHEYLGKKYNMKYICTSRLNQDVLEHFFGAIRSKGGLNDHPSPKEFKYRLRKYILARNTEHLKGTGNVGFDNTEWLRSDKENMSLPTNDLPKELMLMNEEDEVSQEESLDDLNETNFQDSDTLKDDTLEYIAGYIIRKLNLLEYESDESSFTWVDQVSKGFLKKPKSSFVTKIKYLEDIFSNENKDEISHRRGIHNHLMLKSKGVELNEKIKSFFFKCRIHFRIRDLNKRIKIQKSKQRIMGFKNMIKINL